MSSSVESVVKRFCIIIGLALIAGIRPGIAAADLSSVKAFDIAPQPVASALLKFSGQSGVQVMSSGEELEGKTSQGVIGTFAVQAALDRLLKGTGLHYDVVDPTTIAIRSNRGKGSSAAASQKEAVTSQTEGKAGRSFSDRFRMAQADRSPNTGNTSLSGSGQNGSKTEPVSLQEIIVTAEKTRNGESLLHTPAPISVVSAQRLANQGQLSLKDYYTEVPGLNLTTGYQGGAPALVTIRGITTSPYGNPTVTAVVDDVPMGPATLLGGGEFTPDLDPSDLEQVEVLRGPQGTLYGANSMGGLIRYVTAQPLPDHFSGRFQAGMSSVQNGAELGYVGRAAVNAPLGDTVAVRVSAFDRSSPGYIDNLQSGQKGVNETISHGSLASALWRPSSLFKVTLNALLQNVAPSGSPSADGGLGDLQQSRLRGTGGGYVREQVYWANAALNLGRAQITSITSDSDFHIFGSIDGALEGLDPVSEALFDVSGTSLMATIQTRKFTQELRLDMPIGDRSDWLLGGFYDRERSENGQPTYSVEPVTLAVAGFWGPISSSSSYEEYSAFTDLTYHFTDRVDIQLGGRETHIRQSQSSLAGGIWVSVFGESPSTIFPGVTESAFTYLATPRFKISPNLMVYARLASGFRPGTRNSLLTDRVDLPVQSQPDKTKNYELGLKGDFLDHKLTVDSSLYYIDWKNIQIQLYSAAAGFYYDTNESAAKSEGVELSVDSKPLPGMSLSGWVAWNEAVVTQAFPAASTAYALPGYRLPYSARISGHLALSQSFPISADVTGDVGIAESYVGNRIGSFTSSPLRQVYSPYAEMDLHADVSYRSWTGNLYVNNAMDKRETLLGGIGEFPPNVFTYITPRTVGLTLTKVFE